VLALLALACFPVLAQAGSVGPQYTPDLPDDGGAKQNENIAKTSESPPTGGAEAPPNTGSSESYPEEVPSSESEGGAASGGNGGGPGPGNPDKGNNPSAETKVQSAAPIAKATPDSSSDDGGSSPLVPILIAIVALAAISIAAVMIRQRRQRDGSSPSLSTKAG
jgi:hypothetical protein